MKKQSDRVLETIMGTDVYKTSHKTLYPKGLTKVFSNFTPRSGNWAKPDLGFVVADGMRYVIKKIREEWQEFFDLDNHGLDIVIMKYEDKVKQILGIEEFDGSHFRELYSKRKLPLEFRAVEEGTHVPYKTPVLTVHNTDDKFAWLVNYMETRISSELWPIITASTRAYAVKQILLKYADKTGTSRDFVPFQGNDFSFRGMMTPEAAKAVGMGHLKHFEGSDNLPAILESGHGTSVIATEHSIQSALHGNFKQMVRSEDEMEELRRILKI